MARAIKEAELAPEAARRVVEGFNVLRTLVHLDSTSGEKRAQTFPIARAEEVLRLVYPSRVLTQRRLQQEERLKNTLQAFREPRPFGVPRQKLEKIELPQKSPSPSLDEVLQQLEPERVVEEAKAASARTLRDQINLKLLAALTKTAELVSRFPAEEVAATALGHWGEGIRPVLRILWRLCDRDPDKLPKEAGFRVAAEEASPYRELGKLYELLQKAAQIDEDEDELDRAAPPGAGRGQAFRSGRGRGRRASNGDVGDLLWSSLLSSPARGSRDGVTDIPMSIRAVRALEVLDRIGDEDPVLRRIPRKDLLRAFNQISQSYPQAASNYLTARALLRKVLLSEGYLDPMDLASAGKMELGMARTPPLESV